MPSADHDRRWCGAGRQIYCISRLNGVIEFGPNGQQRTSKWLDQSLDKRQFAANTILRNLLGTGGVCQFDLGPIPGDCGVRRQIIA